MLEATWLIDQLKLKDGATGPFNIELFTGSPDDNNAKYFFKGAWDLLQPYFEKGRARLPVPARSGWRDQGLHRWRIAEDLRDELEDRAGAEGHGIHP